MEETHTEKKSLYTHVRRSHEPRNPNVVHKAEATSLNARLALLLTTGVASMWCAYLFAILAIVGFPGFHATSKEYVQWVSQTFIQLVMLSVIMVGQRILGRTSEIMAEEQFQTTRKSYNDIEQIMEHLSVQDTKILEAEEELLKQTQMLTLIVKSLEQSRSRLVRTGTKAAQKDQIIDDVHVALTTGLKQMAGERV